MREKDWSVAIKFIAILLYVFNAPLRPVFVIVEPLLYRLWTQPKCQTASLKQRGILLRPIFDLVLRLGLRLRLRVGLTYICSVLS